MYIKKLKVQNFRNYEEQEIEFNKNINVIYGDNAQGKTNILEAIFLTSFGKSFRTTKEKEIINKDKDFAKVYVEYEKEDRDGKIQITLADKKEIKINGVKIKKLSELLGTVNIVIFTPDDMDILKDGPQQRRRFLDMMIGQIRTNYVHNLNSYIKTLEQRNNYLKSRSINEAMLDIWDEKLAEYGEKIYQYRNEYIEKIKLKIKDIHKEITDEDISIVYKSDCENKEKYLKKLKENRELDKLKGYTSKGTHKDDFKVLINGEDVRIYGSQGQNRTSILSLKLAELQVIHDEIREYPILLLDDFMSELDEKRIKKFLQNIENIQVIITCTRPIEIENSKLFNVIKGKIKEA